LRRYERARRADFRLSVGRELHRAQRRSCGRELWAHGGAGGSLGKPFTAVSPEVAGTWKFTPKSQSAGTFSYEAKNIGGATGTGSGTYVLSPTPQGGGKIKLAGTGSIHSPVGDFSAAITESISLTPLRSCGRVGTE